MLEQALMEQSSLLSCDNKNAIERIREISTFWKKISGFIIVQVILLWTLQVYIKMYYIEKKKWHFAGPENVSSQIKGNRGWYKIWEPQTSKWVTTTI